LQSADAAFLFNVGGSAANQVNASGFAEAPGNALSKGVITGAGLVVGSTFQLYFQATLSEVTAANGISPPTSLSAGTYTVVGSITEVVGSVNNFGSQSTATFGVAPVQAAQSGLTMYFNPAPGAANPSTGAGFTGPTVLLTATPVPSVPGNNNAFTSTLPPPFQTFNQTPSGTFPGVQAVNGSGTYVVNFATNPGSVNNTFFPQGAPPVLSLLLNGSTLPYFTQVAPSLNYVGAGPGGTTVTPNIGAVNGLSGPDFALQTTGNLSAVPEPSSLVLTGLGLGGLALAFRKRNAATA